MSRPSGTIEMKSGEKWPVGFTYRDPDIPAGVSISSVVAAVSPVGLTVGSGQYSGNSIWATVNGGTVGTDYTVRFTTTLNNGNILIDDFVVKVRS